MLQKIIVTGSPGIWIEVIEDLLTLLLSYIRPLCLALHVCLQTHGSQQMHSSLDKSIIYMSDQNYDRNMKCLHHLKT